jgi:serine/threonine protein kinase
MHGQQAYVHTVLTGSCFLLLLAQGLVKLADFGVAAKLGELEEQHCDELHQNVVGTPYWMAPEVSVVPHTNRPAAAATVRAGGASHVSTSRQHSELWACLFVSSGPSVEATAAGVMLQVLTAPPRQLACSQHPSKTLTRHLCPLCVIHR